LPQAQRAVSPYVNGVCTGYGAWANIGGANPGASYTDSTLVDGFCYMYQYLVRDNVDNLATYTSANEVRRDNTAPFGTINAAPAGPIGGAANSITGTSGDTFSGVQKVDVKYSGPMSGPICLAPASPTAWTCNWNTIGLTDGLYTITLEVTDNAGTRETAAINRAIIVDNNPPIASFASFAPSAGAGFQHWAGGASTTLFFNPTQTGSTIIAINASDAGTGMNRVQFPALGGGWAPAGGNNSVGPTPYTFTYSWGVGAASPGLLSTYLAFDNAGNSTPVSATITADSTAPSGGTLSYTNAIIGVTTTPITFATGADVGAGLGVFKLQRQVATYSAGACGVFSAFSDIGPASPVSPYNDATLANGSCYNYQLVVPDFVGNVQTVASGNTVKIDNTPPTGTINAAPAGPIGGAVNSITGTSADTMSGVQKVDVKYSGPMAGNIWPVPRLAHSVDLQLEHRGPDRRHLHDHA